MPPATQDRIAVTSEDLASDGYADIPADYAQFLMLANGVQSTAFVLFGTEPMGMTEPDIYEATEDALEGGDSEQGLVVGHAQGDLGIAYAADEQKYQIIDKSCGDVLFEYASLADFIIDWLDRKKM